MKPIFDMLEVDLVVENIAMGANNCRPYIFAYEAQGSSNPDWVSWEQSYNCGRDKSIFELVARYALRKKAVLYMSASGGFLPTECSITKVQTHF
jgi:hypothetical protein